MDDARGAGHPRLTMPARPVLQTVRGALGLLLPSERLGWVGLGLLGVLSALLEAAGAAGVVVLVELLATPRGVPAGRAMALLVALAGSDPRDLASTAALAVALVQAARIGAGLLLAWWQARLGARTSLRLATGLLEGYLQAPYLFHLRRGSPSLVAMLVHSVPAFQLLFMSALVALFTEGLTLSALAILLAASAPGPALGAFGVLGCLVFVAIRVGHRRQHALGQAEQLSSEQLLRSLEQTFSGIKEVKAFGRERAILAALSRDQKVLAETREHRGAVLAVPRLWIEGIFLVGMLLVLAVLAQRTELAQVLPLLGLGAYAGFRAVPCANRIIVHVASLRYAAPHLQRLIEDHASVVAPIREAPREPTGPLPLAEALALEGVSFSFDGRKQVLDRVTTRLERGGSLGVIGPSGAGKTTLVNLLLGLLEPGSGRITVDGLDVAGHGHAWRRSIGYVPQDPVLLDDSIRRNVAFGVPAAEIDERRLAAAVRAARLDELLAELPHGLETVIGGRGVRLSGGQRQRVAIARALYDDPPILLFDEATSALDPQTEREVTQAISVLARSKTLVVVAHRIQTVRGCDRLLLLRDGRVDDEGSFEELTVRSASFRTLLGDQPAA